MILRRARNENNAFGVIPRPAVDLFLRCQGMQYAGSCATLISCCDLISAAIERAIRLCYNRNEVYLMAKKKTGAFNLPAVPSEGPSLLPIIILFLIPEPFTKIIGAFLLYKRLKNAHIRRRNTLFRRYANAIGSRTEVSIRELAAHMDMPTANVASDLQEMIDQGIIAGNAYIDHSHMKLYLDTDKVDVEDLVDKVVNIFINPDDRAKTVAAAKAA